MPTKLNFHNGEHMEVGGAYIPEDILRLVFHRELLPVDTLYTAAMSCKTLNRLVSADGNRITDVCMGAARTGYLNVLAYLDDHNQWCRAELLEVAVIGGSIPCVDYVVRCARMSIDHIPLSIAALNGHLDMIKYYHEKGAQVSVGQCENAIIGGHLHVVAYIAVNIPNDEHTGYRLTYKAAEHDRLEILKYLVRIGAYFDDNTYMAAAYKGHERICEYLHWVTRFHK